jgi:proteasome assembly chaperone (PAC2) family protein
MENEKLNDPILIAAWPGMGQVAIAACYYMISKLKMEFRAEYASSELFDADHVVIEAGLVQPFRYPRNQVFAWKNPQGENDLLVFIGEAQPPQGRYDFCRKLVDFAQREGVKKIFTFAAMATNSDLQDESRVVGVATDKDTLHGFLENQIQVLSGGSISGMNGILLGVAAERHLPGGCLLGEMPRMFVNVPYPKASVAVLKAMSEIANIDIDLSELVLESERMEAQLSQMLEQVRRLEQQQREVEPGESDETFIPDPVENEKLSPEEKQHLEQLFELAEDDRSKAFELKKELDRLDVFRDYEDRFLDLFREEGGEEPPLQQ